MLPVMNEECELTGDSFMSAISAARRSLDVITYEVRSSARVPQPRTASDPLYTIGHQRAHRNEKPFACSYEGCGKAFARSHDCKRHELLHLNVR